MDKISVIVPVHNPPLEGFRNCLESLSRQTYDNYEVILVDDDSNDDYRKFLDNFRNKIPDFKLIRQKHGGVSRARNTGIQHATGKYIAFCDSDDYLEDDYLSSLEKNIEDADVIICGVAEKMISCIDSSIDVRDFFSKPSQYLKLQYVNFCWNKLYRASIIKEYNLSFDENISLGEDALFVCDYLRHCSRIRTINKNLYHYLTYETSAVHKYNPDLWEQEHQVIELQMNLFGNSLLSEKEGCYLQYWLFRRLKGIIDHYVVNEVDAQIFRKYLNDIFEDKIFQSMYSLSNIDNNPWFGLRHRLFLKIWKKYGVSGIIWSRKIKRIRKCKSVS
ncbi:glycosyltransferase family 2 protein [Dialister sp.]|uniref:glycosyltransferase family 2 protein n=1 Tax=Dialister sp. TaxID=1955814 RepID=UPI002E81286C|nr:glycosyltransferase [Dialister sp.]MEE3452896.1 glycosyltransferase [Dialister sp.]